MDISIWPDRSPKLSPVHSAALRLQTNFHVCYQARLLGLQMNVRTESFGTTKSTRYLLRWFVSIRHAAASGFLELRNDRSIGIQQSTLNTLYTYTYTTYIRTYSWSVFRTRITPHLSLIATEHCNNQHNTTCKLL